MKKLLLIALIALLIFIACEKIMKEYCWKCYIIHYQKIELYDDIIEKHTTDSITMCGYTELDIQKYERSQTIKPYSISTGGLHVLWQDCYCIKKE